MGSLAQALFVFLMLPMLTAARGMRAADLPAYLADGALECPRLGWERRVEEGWALHSCPSARALPRQAGQHAPACSVPPGPPPLCALPPHSQAGPASAA